LTTRVVVSFLEEYKGEYPFFLQVGFVNPHDICEYEHEHEERWLPGPIELGMLSEEELPPLPRNFYYDERETVLQ
ncbi:unnamed protein product, partial [marine sediment metagenome]